MATTNNTPAISLDAIRTAFLLGWSIVELKSRVMIGTYCSSMDTTTLQVLSDPEKDPISKFPQLFPSAKRAYQFIHTSMKEKLGVTINALPKSPDPPKDASILSPKASDDQWMTSTWRTLFNRIVALQTGRFNTINSSGTIYDVPVLDPNAPSTPNEMKQYPYPYLYPTLMQYPDKEQRDDYCGTGIMIEPGNAMQNFHLYEVTRRSLNSLIILFTNPDESLIPETMQKYRRWVVQDLLYPTSVTPYDPNNPALDENTIRIAIKIFSGLIIRFLEAWESYLHESYYIDPSANPQTDPDKSNREIELTAYKAGQSLSALSWNLSATIAPLETAANSKPPLSNETLTILEGQVQKTFSNVFNKIDVVYTQHQISNLSTALDDIYYSNNPNVQRPTAENGPLQSNLALPSESIQAIIMSLNYWRRVAEHLSNASSPPDTPPQPQAEPSQKKGQQANNVPITPADLDWTKALTWESSAYLRLALIQQSRIWHALLLREQDLSVYTVERVTQRLLTRFMKKIEDALLNTNMKRRILTIEVTVSLVLVLLLIGLFFIGQHVQDIAAVFLFVFGGLFAFLGSVASRLWSGLFPVSSTSPQGTPALNQNIMDQLGTVFGSAIHEAFQDAYQRIQIEFGYLDHAVSVTYPLVDFFIHQKLKLVEETGDISTPTSIKDAYDFLTTVIWTSEDLETEIDNIVSAAFGPIGAFIEVQTQQPTPKNTR